ncbi:hypothetical protein LCGC14_0990810, partial [marine sediment metagenome]
KLNNEIELVMNFKQTKDVSFVKSEPAPSETEVPNYQYNIKIPSEGNVKVTLELQAKIITRVTKLKSQFLKETN